MTISKSVPHYIVSLSITMCPLPAVFQQQMHMLHRTVCLVLAEHAYQQDQLHCSAHCNGHIVAHAFATSFGQHIRNARLPLAQTCYISSCISFPLLRRLSERGHTAWQGRWHSQASTPGASMIALSHSHSAYHLLIYNLSVYINELSYLTLELSRVYSFAT